MMNVELVKVTKNKKEILYRLLQFALYDSTQYIDNEITEEAIFNYKYFENYFTEKNRDAYFIKCNNKLVGFVMINEYFKFNHDGKAIAEFLIIPKYRRKHIGQIAAEKAFELYKGNWEVQPMENNPNAYKFWKNVVEKYTNNSYIIKNNGIEDVFIFKN